MIVYSSFFCRLNKKINSYEAENSLLKETIEKLKEGAVEVLIEKEKEILALKMKLESAYFPVMKKSSSIWFIVFINLFYLKVRDSKCLQNNNEEEGNFLKIPNFRLKKSSS